MVKGMNTGIDPAMAEVAEAALRGSGMDCVGLYRLGEEGRMDGVILGMPDAFTRAYETQGIPIDPVLARVRQSGAPASTLVTLGRRWTACHLYQRVSGRFGLTGFATFPLYDDARLTGMLYLGAMNEANARRLDHEGLCAMTPQAIRVATRMMRLPRPTPALSPRQAEVVALAAEGLTNRQIANALGTGEAAVHKHMKSLHAVFNTHTRAALAAASLATQRR